MNFNREKKLAISFIIIQLIICSVFLITDKSLIFCLSIVSTAIFTILNQPKSVSSWKVIALIIGFTIILLAFIITHLMHYRK